MRILDLGQRLAVPHRRPRHISIRPLPGQDAIDRVGRRQRRRVQAEHLGDGLRRPLNLFALDRLAVRPGSRQQVRQFALCRRAHGVDAEPLRQARVQVLPHPRHRAALGGEPSSHLRRSVRRRQGDPSGRLLRLRRFPALGPQISPVVGIGRRLLAPAKHRLPALPHGLGLRGGQREGHANDTWASGRARAPVALMPRQVVNPGGRLGG